MCFTHENSVANFSSWNTLQDKKLLIFRKGYRRCLALCLGSSVSQLVCQFVSADSWIFFSSFLLQNQKDFITKSKILKENIWNSIFLRKCWKKWITSYIFIFRQYAASIDGFVRLLFHFCVCPKKI